MKVLKKKIQLSHCSYWVRIGSNIFEDEKFVSEFYFLKSLVNAKTRNVVLVTDDNLSSLHENKIIQIRGILDRNQINCEVIVLPNGEASKSADTYFSLLSQMVNCNLDRSSAVIALGGGVIGDLAGFCASSYYRGIPYVNIPTSIVAQVDSSIGGKTGINLPEGKNLVGAFHQPLEVLCDIDFLRTLPSREFNQGVAEIIKHALISDISLFNLLEDISKEDGALNGLSDRELEKIIFQNIKIKGEIVEEDEKELTGRRALLNFGHTIGHGIEAAGGYSKNDHNFLHGEAISLGIVAAVKICVDKKLLSINELERVINLLKFFKLPVVFPKFFSDRFPKNKDILDIIFRDKKFVSREINFVLLHEIGSAFLSKDVKTADIERAIDFLR